uniref:Uncharacterized protein n=1 Tax=Quercus lobata TaxID=97700 RepID=A0A7N2R3I0_QUELO
MAKPQLLLLTLFCVFFLLPSSAFGDCTCDTEDEEHDKTQALKYKLAAIASILVGGVTGVCIPVLGKTIPALRPEKDVFFFIKAFAAGVILSTGFIHVLPDAFENLTSPCLSDSPWQDFPFTGLLKTGLEMWRWEESMRATYTNTRATPSFVDNSASSDLIRHRVISQVLELGIVVHSVIIGISLGASESPKTIRPLVAALTFHQFFEGMGLGGCIAQAKFQNRAVVVMATFFSLTTPVGIAIGIGISNVYNENSPRALIFEGIFNAASAGILIYMAQVDLLAVDYMNPRVQSHAKLQIGVNVSLLLGAGLMSLLAKWA